MRTRAYFYVAVKQYSMIGEPRAHVGFKARDGSYTTHCGVHHRRYYKVDEKQFKHNPCRLCFARLAAEYLEARHR